MHPQNFCICLKCMAIIIKTLRPINITYSSGHQSSVSDLPVYMATRGFPRSIRRSATPAPALGWKPHWPTTRRRCLRPLTAGWPTCHTAHPCCPSLSPTRRPKPGRSCASAWAPWSRWPRLRRSAQRRRLCPRSPTVTPSWPPTPPSGFRGWPCRPDRAARWTARVARQPSWLTRPAGPLIRYSARSLCWGSTSAALSSLQATTRLTSRW